ncbi:iron complex transport system ATP-binding protein [Paenibacillus phyllosphaerae]|uniref:Iron complex transport system ATP-binding protein n=1 Tax=Paenibacillus phyllosphaerae TaxID=274593 RepID=A0A7W5B140_9BACL|nr:ABC transporter ATP-binding protein [Paenibacillus phyllosphaerae]MBB3112458.1 iron complex transport system ATP-binding protein [Paenibacillus phyllosphaerae]
MDIRQLNFAYVPKSGQLQLHEIDCRIPEGKITTIIGPNGCGKSTLLGVMSQNYKPTGGEVILDGKDIAKYKAKELAKKLAVVHQQNEAPPDMTVEQLVRLGRMAHKGLLSPQTDADEEAIEWAIASTNLLPKRSLPLEQLSGGEKQRAWIAMALAQRTPMLFLDEPTTFLDIYYQIEVLELVRELNASHGLTIVMVLHDMNQAIRYSDQLVVMKDGRICHQGTPRDIMTAELIQTVYGVKAIVREEENAGLNVVAIGI